MILSRPTRKLFWKTTLTWGSERYPLLRNFGYNDNSIRNQKIFKTITGNVKANANIEISKEPISCRKKNKSQ